MNIDKKKVIALPIGAAVIAIGFTVYSCTPVGKKLSGHTLHLTNDVGEVITVKDKTIRAQPDASKENLVSMADSIQNDVKEANQPLNANSIESCKELESASASKASWTRLQASPYSSDYSTYIAKHQEDIDKYQPECDRDLAQLRLDKKKLKESSDQVKDVVAAVAREKGWLEYTPTFKYKILVTDVNGTTSVQDRTIICMTEKSVSTMPDFMLKDKYPYAQTKFDNPESLTLTQKAGELSTSSIFATNDARQIADQAVCESQGYLAVIPDLES